MKIRAASSRDAASPGPEPAAGPAAALVALVRQVDAGWPLRARTVDGIPPNEAHRRANPASDHATGDALDITHDPQHGPDLGALAKALLKDPRTHYVIWQRQIANPEKSGGAWRPYTGTSPHEDHLHLSIYASRRDDAAPWDLAGVARGDAPGPDEPAHPVAAVRAPDSVEVQGFGTLALEDYVARVVTAELGASRQPQALAAQAMAARSYVVWAMTHQGYGTRAKPVPNSARFQVCARAATPLCIEATAATRGGLVLHGGQLVLTTYVAGAKWRPGAATGRDGHDPTGTERHVTYNEGLAGTAVVPTSLVAKFADNRGCLSQHGAVELGQRGYEWPAILRYFYGADLEFTCSEPSRPVQPSSPGTGGAPVPPPVAPRPPEKAPPRPPAKAPAKAPAKQGGGTDSGPLLLAAAVAAYRLFG